MTLVSWDGNLSEFQIFLSEKKNPKLKNKKQKKAVGFVEVYECPGTEHFYRNICHMC